MRALKSGKGTAAEVDVSVKELLALKQQYKDLTGQDSSVVGAKIPKKSAAEKSASQKFELKTPKGMRDYGPADMAVRQV